MPFKSLLILFVSTFLLISCKSERSTNVIDEDDNSSVTPEQCVDGSGSSFSCQNVELLSIVPLNELGAQGLNDIWGWKDPVTNIEYALVGTTNSISFVDISDPENPVVVGILPESRISNKYKAIPSSDFPACNLGIGTTNYSKSITEGSTWRDHKVYNDHLFIVSDAQPHGMQVFDLTRLREYSGTRLQFSQDALYDRFANAHNIVINEATGFAYVAGVTQAELCGSRGLSGLHIVDIRDPKAPVFAGCYADAATDAPSSPNVAPGYIHDAQCITYDGPDADHAGKEVCFNSAEGNIVISDVTDKANTSTISFDTAPDMQYSHQGWLTEDRRYFLMNDEVDELNLGRRTRTYVWDVSDLDNPDFEGFYNHSTNAIDHNLYVKGNYVYMTNYTSGLQIFELTDLENAQMERVAYFDTTPETEAVDFEGTWSSYPYFESGVVILSDITGGLFVVRPDLGN